MDENELASRLEELVVAKLGELPELLRKELGYEVSLEEFDLSLRLFPGPLTARLRGRDELVRVDVD